LSTPIAVLYRQNDLDDLDHDLLVQRIALIREQLPTLRRMEDDKDGDMRFEKDVTISATIGIQQGQVSMRYEACLDGRSIRTRLEIPRDDRLMDDVAEHGLRAWVDVVEQVVSAPRGGVASFEHIVSNASTPGLDASRVLDEALEAAMTVLATHNPAYPRSGTISIKAPHLGFAGAICDQAGKQLLSRPVERALLTRCTPSAVLGRVGVTHVLLPIESRANIEDRHVDPIAAMRIMADLGMKEIPQSVLTKAGRTV
jgi:hypothetical protein